MPPNETPFRRDAESRRGRRRSQKSLRVMPPLQVSILLPNVGRILLDNFAVLHYGSRPARRFGSKLGLQIAYRFNAPNFTALTTQ